ncbi:MAG TPA: BolA/IbaG family iron-sulfur metabolism protein [Kofleriaceae bacterium]|nr:BolA/IbaG family iron-sulfur metabolism protein [Kofleriaceae bacterium]
MKPEHIAARIRAALPDAQITLNDLTGTEDHWHATVISTAFTGKSLIERHRLVMAALADEMKGPIHALTLDVKCPGEA